MRENLNSLAEVAKPEWVPTSKFHSLVDILQWRAAHQPDSLVYTFLQDGESLEENVTFLDLDQRARVIANHLLRLEAKGARALIVYDPGIEYIAALLGCFYASVIAVPVYPPDPMRVTRTLSRLETIIRDSRAQFMLTSSSKANWSDALARTCESLKHVVFTDQLEPTVNGPWEWQQPSIGSDEIALLQYTSGSTGSPKGCIISHGNLMYNFRHVQQFDEPNAVAVSWLPMYHDMGLIGTVLQSLYSGRRLVLMSPLAFIQRPFRWLQAISKYRAYATSAPNFAYDLCVRKVTDQELRQLDLSCWTLGCSGAEQVRSETLDRFAEKFERCGFRREALYPCYGLAEATLIVSGGQKHEPPVVAEFDAAQLSAGRAQPANGQGNATRKLVGCGKQVDGCHVKIVDPQSHEECHEGQVGEIWVHSPGVGKGYWARPEESAAVFRAALADQSETAYLRTGDLGFLIDGELFVTGRRKDLLIINGRNHYPQDIEEVVNGCHRSLRRGATVACSVEVQNQERLVCVQEVMRSQRLDLEDVLSTIRATISRELQLDVYAILLVKGGSVPKTSSGKIQRQACRQKFLDGELEVVAEFREPTSTDKSPYEPWPGDSDTTPSRNGKFDKTQITRDVVRLFRDLKSDYPDEISPQTRLFADLGLASIEAMEFHARVEQRYDRRFPLDQLMADIGSREDRDATVGEFVDFLYASLATPATESSN